MSGFEFSCNCPCGGELSVLTRTQPDDMTTSARVVCRSCGTQHDVIVAMTSVAHWTEEAARLGTANGVYSEQGARA